MIKIEFHCDECGAPATYFSGDMTGRVLIDGRDKGSNDVMLCNTHKPSADYPWQPRNTARMVFFWSDGRGGNRYPPLSE
jgi:hypothetical protein